MLDRFLSQTSFSSYEDFRRDYRVLVPENFNFAYDVVDEIAAEAPVGLLGDVHRAAPRSEAAPECDTNPELRSPSISRSRPPRQSKSPSSKTMQTSAFRPIFSFKRSDSAGGTRTLQISDF